MGRSKFGSTGGSSLGRFLDVEVEVEVDAEVDAKGAEDDDETEKKAEVPGTGTEPDSLETLAKCVVVAMRRKMAASTISGDGMAFSKYLMDISFKTSSNCSMLAFTFSVSPWSFTNGIMLDVDSMTPTTEMSPVRARRSSFWTATFFCIFATIRRNSSVELDSTENPGGRIQTVGNKVQYWSSMLAHFARSLFGLLSPL